MSRVFVYDTTLRDGSQGEGVNFSLQDKLLITKKLDELGVDFVEGGYPLSNPKDFEYFREVRTLPLKHAKVVAFGMTRRKNTEAANDTGIKALFKRHRHGNAMTYIVSTEIYGHLERVMDRFESVAHRISGLVIEQM